MTSYYFILYSYYSQLSWLTVLPLAHGFKNKTTLASSLWNYFILILPSTLQLILSKYLTYCFNINIPQASQFQIQTLPIPTPIHRFPPTHYLQYTFLLYRANSFTWTVEFITASMGILAAPVIYFSNPPKNWGRIPASTHIPFPTD